MTMMKTTAAGVGNDVVPSFSDEDGSSTYIIILLEVTPKARQPLMSCPSDSSVVTGGT